MPQPLGPSEVFHALVRGVCDRKWDDLPGLYAEQTNVVHPLDPFRAPPLLTREQLHEHFAGGTRSSVTCASSRPASPSTKPRTRR